MSDAEKAAMLERYEKSYWGLKTLIRIYNGALSIQNPTAEAAAIIRILSEITYGEYERELNAIPALFTTDAFETGKRELTRTEKVQLKELFTDCQYMTEKKRRAKQLSDLGMKDILLCSEYKEFMPNEE